MTKRKNPHAQALGRLGGKAKSAKKTAANLKNGLISGIKRKMKETLDSSQALGS